jgi:rifampicin phosphotransferase
MSAYNLIPLSAAQDARLTGGKASNLARLIALGQPVPTGYVISDAILTSVLQECGLEGTDAIATRIRDIALPRTLLRELECVHASLVSSSLDPLIVRSSAIGEDSHDASFAGQLDSIADVVGLSALTRAILDVWASRWSARALAYQRARDRTLHGMAIIVQRQISSSISGVLFTVAPQSAGDMLVEYCGGSGEALVAGRENPGRLTIARDRLEWAAQATPERPIAGDTRLLNDKSIRELGGRAREIERAFGTPQDIEWTIDGDGGLWIVQARPITTVSPQSVHFSNANVNENFPAPISPLLYSIARTGYYHYFRNLGRAFGFSSRRLAAMEQPLRHIIAVHGARMYYNLTSIHGVLRSAPFGEALATWFNQFVGAEATASPAVAPMRKSVRLKPDATEIAEVARILAQTTWQYLLVTRRVEEFERTANAFADRTHPDRLRTRSTIELLEDVRAFVDIRNHRWKNASLADVASMVCYGALQRWLRAAFPSADQAALHNSLLKALPDLPSGLPALKLWDLSRLIRADRRLLDLVGTLPAADALSVIRHDPSLATFRRELDRFLDEWGFRCSGELMLTVPNFQDEPERLLEILTAYVGMDDESPAAQLRVQAGERVRETERVAAVLRRRRLVPFVPLLHQWHVMSVLLRWTQRSITLRERARLKQALLYSRLRKVLLTLGDRLVSDRRLARADDIFFFTVDELDDLVTASGMFPHHAKALVDLRRKAHADVSALTPPDSLVLAEGDAWAGVGARDPHGEPRTASSEQRLSGLGVCGGRTTSRAAVLNDVSEAHRLRARDILVTRQTDPGWGAVFPLISGLIMERGGMLSHGAIIAREFGIPSVVGVADATTRIAHGSRVHVDGDRGIVRSEIAACEG